MGVKAGSSCAEFSHPLPAALKHVLPRAAQTRANAMERGDMRPVVNPGVPVDVEERELQLPQ